MTTDMQARDEKEFEAWVRSLPVEEIERSKRDKDMPKIIWKAALAAERARSAVLVEALEKVEKYHPEVGGVLHSISVEALKQYRGEG